MRRWHHRWLGALLGVAWTVVACGGPAASPATSPMTTMLAPHTTSETQPSPTPDARDVPTAAPTGATGTLVDPTLLELVPSPIAGHDLRPVPEAAEQLAADPSIGPIALGVAVGLVADVSTTSADFAVVTIVALRPGQFSEAFLERWATGYDQSACEPAGGIAGREEVEIAGRTVLTATCTEGARTYHVHLPDRDAVVSATDVGESALGRVVFEQLDVAS